MHPFKCYCLAVCTVKSDHHDKHELSMQRLPPGHRVPSQDSLYILLLNTGTNLHKISFLFLSNLSNNQWTSVSLRFSFYVAVDTIKSARHISTRADLLVTWHLRWPDHLRLISRVYALPDRIHSSASGALRPWARVYMHMCGCVKACVSHQCSHVFPLTEITSHH